MATCWHNMTRHATDTDGTGVDVTVDGDSLDAHPATRRDDATRNLPSVRYQDLVKLLQKYKTE